MTIGKVTKKESHLTSRTFKFMKKSTDNLTLKDFAELIEFMNDSGKNRNTGGQGAARQTSKPILGLSHFLEQRNQARLNNQGSASAGNRPRTNLTYKRNEWAVPPEPERKRENDVTINPFEPPGGRVKVEYIEQ